MPRPTRKPVTFARAPEPQPFGVDPLALSDPDLWDEVVGIFRSLPSPCRANLIRAVRHVAATPERVRVRLVDEIAEALEADDDSHRSMRVA